MELLRKLLGGGELASLTLAQYIDLIAEVPLPTTQQRENFAEFVSHAHSWYKHLPYGLPGAPFYFFIDKYAGCDLVITDRGTPGLTERTEQGFHYSYIPTQDYRTCFGHLAFSCGLGRTVFRLGPSPVVVPRDKVAAVPGDDAQMYGLPTVILEAGMAQLTGAMHTHSANYPFWDGLEDWPEESGGRNALEKIAARCRTMKDSAFKKERMWIDHGPVDPVLYELLAPEQRRQRGEIIRAVDRICEFISGQGGEKGSRNH
jgi:hypothetical protein